MEDDETTDNNDSDEDNSLPDIDECVDECDEEYASIDLSNISKPAC